MSRQSARARAAAACGVAIATLLPPAAFQLGLLKTLADPPLPIFDSEQLISSKSAHPLGIPDSLPGIANYTATLALILAAPHSGFARAALPYKLSADASAATFNTARGLLKYRKLCSWCVGTAIATVVMVHYGRKSLR